MPSNVTMYDHADIVRHFLRIEADKPQWGPIRDTVLAWCDLDDNHLFNACKRWDSERSDTNPVFQYTIYERSCQIDGWKREAINGHAIYSCGINDGVNVDLDDVAGNLFDFAHKYSSKHGEFNQDLEPADGERAIIIVVEHSDPNRDGKYELIDGAHRAVAEFRRGKTSLEAFVGVTRAGR